MDFLQDLVDGCEVGKDEGVPGAVCCEEGPEEEWGDFAGRLSWGMVSWRHWKLWVVVWVVGVILKEGVGGGGSGVLSTVGWWLWS